jgi:hypothetical protein
MNGYGVYTWNDGSTYEGEFVNGKPYGKGKMIEYINGWVHEGLFENTSKIVDSVYGPDYYILNEGTPEGKKYLRKACEDGWTYYRRKVLAKGGDHLNVFNKSSRSFYSTTNATSSLGKSFTNEEKQV